MPLQENVVFPPRFSKFRYVGLFHKIGYRKKRSSFNDIVSSKATEGRLGKPNPCLPAGHWYPSQLESQQALSEAATSPGSTDAGMIQVQQINLTWSQQELLPKVSQNHLPDSSLRDFILHYLKVVIATWVPSLGSCFRQLAFLSALVAKLPPRLTASATKSESFWKRWAENSAPAPTWSIYLYMIQGAVEPASTTVVQGTGFEAAIFVSQRSWHEGLLNKSSPGGFAPTIGCLFKGESDG